MGFKVKIVLCLALLSMAFGQEVRLSEESEEWPVQDENGYYLPYKIAGKWNNWWLRNKPSLWTTLGLFIKSSDRSNIPSNKEELDQTLPIELPYWLNDSSSQSVGAPGIRATWIGHATVLAEVDSTLVLADPIFSLRASPVSWAGRKRYRTAACTVDELPEQLKVNVEKIVLNKKIVKLFLFQAVIISHNHYDHLDYYSVLDLHNRYGTQLHWYVPAGMHSWLVDNFSMNEGNVHEMTWWQEEVVPGTNTKIAFTPANHWCKRTFFGRNKMLWGSWAIIGSEHKYVSVEYVIFHFLF